RYLTAVFLARIVIPRSLSSSPESITRSSTCCPARNVPHWRRSASTSVVFPWSTWATMASARRSARTAADPSTFSETAMIWGEAPTEECYTIHMKRTNLVLDENLLEEATRLAGERTYSRTVERALEDFVRRIHARRILELAGTGLWEGTLAEMREDRPQPHRTRRTRRVPR